MTRRGARRGRSRLLTDRERAARHFHKPVSAVTQRDIERLPKRGTGLRK